MVLTHSNPNSPDKEVKRGKYSTMESTPFLNPNLNSSLLNPLNTQQLTQQQQLQQQQLHQQLIQQQQPNASMNSDTEPTNRDIINCVMQVNKAVVEVNNRVETVNNKLIFIENEILPKIKALEEKTENQDLIIASLNKKVLDMSSILERVEKEQKKKNLIISGLREEGQETSDTLKNTITSILQNDLKTTTIPYRVFRFGSRTLPIRPVRIILNDEQEKFDIFAHLKNSKLYEQKIYINEDLPQITNFNRKLLRDAKKTAEARGATCFLKRDKLKIDGTWYNIQNGQLTKMQQQQSNDIQPMQI